MQNTPQGIIMRLRSTSLGILASAGTSSRAFIRPSSRALCLTTVIVSALSLTACGDEITNNYYVLPDASVAPEPTVDESDAGVTAGEDAGIPPETEPTEPTDSTEPTTEEPEPTDDPEPVEAGPTDEPSEVDSGVPGEEPAADAGADAGLPDRGEFFEGAPFANTDVADFQVDVFGTPGNRYWFATDPAQIEKMNGNQGGGGPIIFKNEFGDIYEPPGGAGVGKSYVESLFVTTPEGQIADFGKLSVRVLGQSTFRPWTPTTIPNIRMDFDHFTKDQRIGGYEHLRFNNGLVGSIFREKLTLDIYRELGYAAPLTQFAWVGSNVWGPDAWIPYTAVEVYKKGFCQRYSEEWGGGCENMWEYVGDFGYGMFDSQDSCQSDECDNTRVKEFDAAVSSTPQGEGYKAALADWLDWDAFHEFQCLSWMLWVGDDTLHNGNNVLLVERTDGKFQFLPYSTDISLGQDWYQNTPLAGTNVLALGCQSDAECWADTVATCDRLVQEFTEMDPVGMLDQEYATLQEQGMLRDGDDDRYAQITTWFEDRMLSMPLELEDNRESPQVCPAGQMLCDTYCTEPQYCYLCEPPVDGEPGPIEEPIPLKVAVDGGEVGDGGDAADIALPNPGDPVEPPPPAECPMINVYKLAK